MASKSPESLGDFIRRVRAQKGLSLADVERQSGRLGRRVAASYINRIENGIKRRVSTDRLRAIARGLGIPEEELAAVEAGRFPSKREDAEELRLLMKFRELPEERKADVLRIIEALHVEHAATRVSRKRSGRAA